MRLSSTIELVAPTVIVSAVPLFLGGIIAWQILARQQRAYEALDRDIAGIRAGEELAIGIRDLRGHLEHFALTADRADWDSAKDQMDQIEVWLQKAKSAADTDREREL